MSTFIPYIFVFRKLTICFYMPFIFLIYLTPLLFIKSMTNQFSN